MRIIDIAGQKRGKLTVVKQTDKRGIKGEVLWECLCKCGNVCLVRGGAFARGEHTSCGCGKIERGKAKAIDLVGQVFNRLTVVLRVENNKYSQARWKCICICGNEHIVSGYLLKLGQVKSCGCLSREKSLENLKLAHIAQTLPIGIAARNRMYGRYKGQASFKNLPFKLTIEDFEKLTKSICHYCGVEPITSYGIKGKKITQNGFYYANGIDRIDNKLGYILSNCVPCCGTCNYAKRGMTQELFMEWIKRITKYYKQ